MKERFEAVEVDIVKIDALDIILSSECPNKSSLCEFELPIIPINK